MIICSITLRLILGFTLKISYKKGGAGVFKRIAGNEKGFMLVYAVMIAVLLIAVSAVALVYAESQSINSIKQKNSMQAYYIADAGITKAKFWISGDVSGRLQANNNVNNLNGTTYNGGKIISAVLMGTGPYYLTCVGAYPDPTDLNKKPKYVYYKTIVAKLDATGFHASPGYNGEATRFSKGLWIDSLTTGSDTIVNSTVYCNGDVTAGSGLTIGQASGPRDVYLDGNFTLGSGCNLYGNVSGRGNVTLGSGQCISQTVKALGSIATGSNNNIDQILANGSITMGSTAGGIKKIQSNSTITLSSNATVDQEMKAQQSITFSSGCKVHGPVWTKQNLTTGSNCTVDGTLYVNGTYTYGSGTTPTTKQTFDPNLLPLLDLASELTDVPSRETINLDSYKSQAQAAGAGHYFSKRSDKLQFRRL